ncbi:uncharacterized protein NEMAJ01_1903 [Nematocida major]|uniref:uncharacterized protein n=1 Tax=Nematocida major TaxID=1912982 RepID=UPI0020085C1B|nr:uncharacterized protein NEMAJ01_1903 [Nematocida major]KAH9387007.1 hypothetical protein NEMAJ01_1903 [Nematocida major]
MDRLKSVLIEGEKYYIYIDQTSVYARKEMVENTIKEDDPAAHIYSATVLFNGSVVLDKIIPHKGISGSEAVDLVEQFAQNMALNVAYREKAVVSCILKSSILKSCLSTYELFSTSELDKRHSQDLDAIKLQPAGNAPLGEDSVSENSGLKEENSKEKNSEEKENNSDSGDLDPLLLNPSCIDDDVIVETNNALREGLETIGKAVEAVKSTHRERQMMCTNYSYALNSIYSHIQEVNFYLFFSDDIAFENVILKEMQEIEKLCKKLTGVDVFSGEVSKNSAFSVDDLETLYKSSVDGPCRIVAYRNDMNKFCFNPEFIGRVRALSRRLQDHDKQGKLFSIGQLLDEIKSLVGFEQMRVVRTLIEHREAILREKRAYFSILDIYAGCKRAEEGAEMDSAQWFDMYFLSAITNENAAIRNVESEMARLADMELLVHENASEITEEIDMLISQFLRIRGLFISKEAFSRIENANSYISAYKIIAECCKESETEDAKTIRDCLGARIEKMNNSLKLQDAMKKRAEDMRKIKGVFMDMKEMSKEQVEFLLNSLIPYALDPKISGCIQEKLLMVKTPGLVGRSDGLFVPKDFTGLLMEKFREAVEARSCIISIVQNMSKSSRFFGVISDCMTWVEEAAVSDTLQAMILPVGVAGTFLALGIFFAKSYSSIPQDV